jgi:hypothetical protein
MNSFPLQESNRSFPYPMAEPIASDHAVLFSGRCDLLPLQYTIVSPWASFQDY